MSRALRSLAMSVLLVCGFSPAHGGEGAALERGTAIIDPAALRELDHGRFGLRRIMAPMQSADIPLTSGDLFALPEMAPVKKALDEDFERYIERHKAELPNESIGVGQGFDFQLFDRTQLSSADTRFVLSGIVNRMDRAYVSEKDCGEIRLIYRLTQTGAGEIGEAAVSPRLPMTLNVVLKAKGGIPVDGAGVTITCAEIARRWLAAVQLAASGAELAGKLTATGGALDLVRPENIERVETNLQIAHAPKSAVRDFRTDYLMKVFDYDARSATFNEVPMENQIDYLKLNTGTSFSLPFDELLVFSTNLQPSDLMDPAFMRRIPYKIKLFAPNREEYRRIFEDVAYVYSLELVDDVFDFVVDRLTVNGKFGLAYYQPKFICEQVVETCKCFNLRPQLTKQLAAEALANLYFDIEDSTDSQAAL